MFHEYEILFKESTLYLSFFDEPIGSPSGFWE